MLTSTTGNDLTTGIDDVSANGMIAVTSDGMTVTAPAGMEVKVFSTDGAIAARYISDGESPQLTLNPGVYVVTVGTTATKVIVR